MRKFYGEGLEERQSRKALLGKAFGICRKDLMLKKKDFNAFSEVVNDFFDAQTIEYLVYDALSEQELKKLIEEIKTVASAPVLTDTEANLKYPAKAVSSEKLTNRPFTPVMSSNVHSRAVDKNKLYVRFHDYDGVYPYELENEEAALRAFHEMPKTSPGRYVWRNLRGKKLGPVWGKPKKETPGGTSSSKVPYSKMGPGGRKTAEKRIGKMSGTDKTARMMSKFKKAVKVPSTSAEPFTTTELRNYQKSQTSPKQPVVPKRTDFKNGCDFNKNGTCIYETNPHYKKECPYKLQDSCYSSDFDDDFSSIVLDFENNAVYLVDKEGEGYIIQDSVIQDSINECKESFKKKYNVSDEAAEQSCFGVIQKSKKSKKEDPEVKKEIKKEYGSKEQLQMKIKQLKEQFKKEPKERRRLSNEINKILTHLTKVTGQTHFPFVPAKKAIGRPRSRGLKKGDMTFDSVQELILDDYGEITRFEGYITHAGDFPYLENGKTIIRHKDFDNLKDIFSNKDYIHTIGAKTEDSHLDINERLNGFATNFKIIAPNTTGIYGPEDIKPVGRVWAEGAFFDNISRLSDLDNPTELNISLGFHETIVGDTQLLDSVEHIAVSMNNKEEDRCRQLGPACTFRIRRNDFFHDHNSIPPQGNYYETNLTKNERNNYIMDLTDKRLELIEGKKREQLIEVFNELNLDNTVSFDSFESNLSKLLKIKNKSGDFKLINKFRKNQKLEEEKEDMTEDQKETKETTDADATNEHGKDVNGCMQSGKGKTECTEEASRKDTVGKHEPYIGDVGANVNVPEFTDVHNINKDMAAKIENLEATINKLTSDFAPYLKQKEDKEQKDFEESKKYLIETCEVCKDFVSTLDFEKAEVIKDAFEKSNLVKEALFYKSPEEYSNPSVLDMAEPDKPKDIEDFSYLKVS